MKKFKNFNLLLLLSCLISFSLTSCSDDDGPSASSLVGDWVIISSNDYDFEKGEYFNFKSDGTLGMSNQYEFGDTRHTWKWSLKNGNLKLEEDADEYTYGPVIIEDDIATYTYNWYFDGKKDRDEYTIVLQKIHL